VFLCPRRIRSMLILRASPRHFQGLSMPSNTVYPAHLRAHLSLTNVSLAFATKQVLNKVDLTVSATSRIGIVGENGRGKQLCYISWRGGWNPTPALSLVTEHSASENRKCLSPLVVRSQMRWPKPSLPRSKLWLNSTLLPRQWLLATKMPRNASPWRLNEPKH